MATRLSRFECLLRLEAAGLTADQLARAAQLSDEDLRALVATLPRGLPRSRPR